MRFALGRRGHDDLAGAAFAGEGDFVNVHVTRQSGAGGFAITGDDVDDAVGKTNFLGEPGDGERGERRLLGRLEDDAYCPQPGPVPTSTPASGAESSTG